MIFDDERALRTINNAPNAHILKIFFYLAFHQPQDGIAFESKNYRQIQNFIVISSQKKVLL